MIFDFSNDVIEIDTPSQEEIEAHYQNVKSAKSWAIVASKQYGLDYKAEYRRKLEDNRKYYIANCGKIGKWQWNPQTLRKEYQVNSCKSPDCPRCKANMEWSNRQRLENLLGYKIVEVSSENEAGFKAGLTKDDYLRIPNGESCYYILNEQTDNRQETLTYDKVLKLALIMIPAVDSDTRISGNLGKDSSSIPEAELDETEQIETVTVSVYEVDFSESDITAETLEQNVLERIEAGERNIQYVIYQLEQMTKQVCKKHNVKILFLYAVQKTVVTNRIEWDNLKVRQKIE